MEENNKKNTRRNDSHYKAKTDFLLVFKTKKKTRAKATKYHKKTQAR